jgi:hypothetical protein
MLPLKSVKNAYSNVPICLSTTTAVLTAINLKYRLKLMQCYPVSILIYEINFCSRRSCSYQIHSPHAQPCLRCHCCHQFEGPLPLRDFLTLSWTEVLFLLYQTSSACRTAFERYSYSNFMWFNLKMNDITI